MAETLETSHPRLSERPPSPAEVTSSPHLSTFDPWERLTPTLGLVTVGPLLEGGDMVGRAGVGVAVSRMGTRRCYPTQTVLVEDILLFVVFANKVVCLCTHKGPDESHLC